MSVTGERQVIAEQAAATIGNTPMVALNRLGAGLGAEVVAKLE